MEYIFIWLMCGIIAAMIGSKKGEGCTGFIIGILLGPFGIIIALLSKGNRKNCPFCKEMIHKDAMICPNCRRSLGQLDLILSNDFSEDSIRRYMEFSPKDLFEEITKFNNTGESQKTYSLCHYLTKKFPNSEEAKLLRKK